MPKQLALKYRDRPDDVRRTKTWQRASCPTTLAHTADITRIGLRLSFLSVWSVAGLFAIVGVWGCVGRVDQRFALTPGDLWIRNVTVVSMERDEPLPNTHVVIRGGQIAWVGAEPAAGANVSVLDGAAKYLVPALIDGHVHLSAPPPGMSEAHRAAMPELVRAFNEQLPRSYLYFGFTTVVELGVKDWGALEQIRSLEIAPTVLDCGSPLVVANGYPMRLHAAVERFELFPNFIYDPQQADSIPSRFGAAKHSPEAAVD